MRLRLLLLWLFLSGICRADLDYLLQLQRQGDPGAYVSSGFDDWRTVSKYRRQAGLHFGYDIAMLAGSPVRAAWPGVVVDVVPWYGQEYGVRVRSPEGFEVTYGHLRPSLRVGQPVAEGEVVGTVVVDHVDVKMLGSDGLYVDFARLAGRPPPAQPVQPTEPAVKPREPFRIAAPQEPRPTTDQLILGRSLNGASTGR